VLGLRLGLVSGSSLVGVCRHLAAVVWSTYTTVMHTTVVSIVDLWSIHDGRVRNINQYKNDVHRRPSGVVHDLHYVAV